MAKTITTGFITDKINGITVNTSLKCNTDNYINSASREVEFIVMHYTGNKKDTAKNNAKYFTSPNREASAHLFVDETSIYQSVELRDKAWHCGTSKTYYHSSCRNSNSIGIEMCTSGDYKISTKTQHNAAFLCAYLCKMLGISDVEVDTYVVRHYDVTHKNCPAQMVSSNNEWKNFKTYVKNILKTGNIAGTITVASTKKASKANKTIQDWQKAAIKDGFKFESGADGIWGPECEAVAKKAVCKDVPSGYINKNLTKIVQKAVGITGKAVDGLFGSGTAAAVKIWQKKNGLTDDGIVGLKSWKKILGVK
jgi:N-acetylmuramoyl-L-alanine amidase CwlA